MEYLKAALLGLIEGTTEFLPISSTGHLIIVEDWLRLSDDEAFNTAFMIIIQLPAILSVMVYFWRDLWPWSNGGERRRALFGLWGKMVVAVIPAIILGLLFDDFLEKNLFAPVPVAIALVVGGIVIIALERIRHVVTFESVTDVTLKIALLIGLFQCLAMIPGTSRSAATIIGAMLLGASRPAAAEFSFFLAIPTMIAATGYSIAQNGLSFHGNQWILLGIGSVVSFAVAYGVIAGFMAYVRHRSFAVFGYYRLVLGGLVLLGAYLGWMG